ncbi:Protein CBG27649 [Caenorhabditis briggsae]|uniref:Protein CBG27649 n=1 Tax=Caenorhabditis briggsae TaxID=6238 RepID=B6IJ94_CAEBR|nr:Protein CBG27649 [Caenorhabditis briggsae]CAR99928.1 Protein CBG27649 [Caenorhabditis briggsae]
MLSPFHTSSELGSVWLVGILINLGTLRKHGFI